MTGVIDTKRDTARERLLELLTRPVNDFGTTELRIWALTRYRSRTGETRIIDFLVIRDNRPISISEEIAALLPRALPNVQGFSPEPGQQHTGMVFGTKTNPEDIINRLSMVLFARHCLKMENL